MGKKEQRIRKLNNAFHAEENARFANRHDEGDVIEDFMKTDDKEVEATLHAYSLLREYADHQGLPLCQHLSYENTRNYIEFISGISPRERIDPGYPIEHVSDPEPVPEPFPEPVLTLTQIDNQITQIRGKSILAMGQSILYNEYIGFCTSTKAVPIGPVEFHRKMSRKADYDTILETRGITEYKRVLAKE